MQANATKSASEQVSVVLVFDGKSIPALLKRLANVKSAVSGLKRKFNWIIVCDGFSAEEFPKKLPIKKLKANVLAIGSAGGDWPAFYHAALASKTGWMLVFPKDSVLDKAAAKSMFSLTPKASWITSTRGRGLNWLRKLMGLFSDAPQADLGSPCLLRRELLVKLGSRYTPGEVLFGYRVLSLAGALRTPWAEIPLSPQANISLSQSLGLNPSAPWTALKKNYDWAILWTLLAYAGFEISKNLAPVGLVVFGPSLFCLLYLFGKQE